MHARVLARMICTPRVIVQHVRTFQVAMSNPRCACTSKQLPDFGSSIPLLHVALLSRDGRCVSVRWFCDAAGGAAPVLEGSKAEWPAHAVRKLFADVTAAGAVHVQELIVADCQSFSSWSKLRPLEARRLLRAAAA